VPKVYDIGVSRHIGRYSDAIECGTNGRLLFISGTPGIRPDGTLPEGVTAQTEQAWENVRFALAAAGMTMQHLVKITQYVINADDIPAYVAARTRLLGDCRPTSTLLVVPALVRPPYLVEVEAIAQCTP
jgi:2-iminobutanoate/2-iminopropanoate deaminase